MGIPQKWRDQLPGEMSIQSLLQFPLPKQGSTRWHKDPQISTLFSSQEPVMYEETLGALGEIPLVSHITGLWKMMEKAKTQGYKSILGGFPGTTTNSRYPLEVVDFWRAMSDTIASKRAWIDSTDWLDDNGHLHLIADKYFCHLPWTKPPSTRLSFSMDHLSVLLSDEWLSGVHIDFFATLFGNVATKNKLPILITTLAFSEAIGACQWDKVSTWTSQVLKCFDAFSIFLI